MQENTTNYSLLIHSRNIPGLNLLATLYSRTTGNVALVCASVFIWECELDSTGSRQGTVAGSCESVKKLQATKT